MCYKFINRKVNSSKSLPTCGTQKDDELRIGEWRGIIGNSMKLRTETKVYMLEDIMILCLHIPSDIILLLYA